MPNALYEKRREREQETGKARLQALVTNDQYDTLRRLAFERRTTISKLTRVAVERYLQAEGSDA